MKTIGLIGGMSWESTQVYYRLLNELTRDRLGGLNSARLVLVSMNFAEIERHMPTGDWDRIGEALAEAAKTLEIAGADFILLGSNTVHKVAATVQAAVAKPVIHICDVTGAAIKAKGLQTIGLLGTRYVMEADFYRDALNQSSGATILIPEATEREEFHRVIFEELCKGVFTPQSKRFTIEIVRNLASRGAQGVVFGCTEIGLLLGPEDLPIPVFDTTELHAAHAIDLALR